MAPGAGPPERRHQSRASVAWPSGGPTLWRHGAPEAWGSGAARLLACGRAFALGTGERVGTEGQVEGAVDGPHAPRTPSGPVGPMSWVNMLPQGSGTSSAPE